MEEQAGLTTAFLKDYQKKHRVDRVLIEYNGMWPLQALYDALPTDWDIYQIILLADSTTFASYMTNMRQLAVDKLQDPEMVIFNRCTDATDKAYLHRAVRMVNRRAQMAFERTDGSVDPDDVVDELPFDTDAPVIDIADEDFGLWYLDAMDNLDKYMGKTVRFKGYVCQTPRVPKGCFVPGRPAGGCCLLNDKNSAQLSTPFLRKASANSPALPAVHTASTATSQSTFAPIHDWCPSPRNIKSAVAVVGTKDATF